MDANESETREGCGMVLQNNLASIVFCSVFRCGHIWKCHQSPVDAIAVRLNRVIKIVDLLPLPSATRDSTNNMARCLMTRSITAPCPASEVNDTTSRAHTRASSEQWNAKRDWNSIAEYQRATDECFSSFLSQTIDRSCTIIPRAKDFLLFLKISDFHFINTLYRHKDIYIYIYCIHYCTQYIHIYEYDYAWVRNECMYVLYYNFITLYIIYILFLFLNSDRNLK